MNSFWRTGLTISVIGLLHFTSLFSVNAATTGAGSLYRGKYIGRLAARQHKVSGEVYAVDSRTLHIRNFIYDGAGPDAFFWTGFTEHPSPQGIIIPNEKGTKEVLGAYKGQDITLTLPEGLSLKDIKWFAVWCRAYEVNFGDMYIPQDLDYPQPHVLGKLAGQHGVSSGPIVVVDAQTILVPDFSYDGQAPDAHFWVGKGKPSPDGYRVADETGGNAQLVKSEKKTMVLSLPGDLTIFDIDYFGVWCRLYYVDFGNVKVPKSLNVPPSLRMLSVTPQTKLNCEVLMDGLALEVRWAVAGESIVIQLVGRIDDGQYMSFGLSGDESRSSMVGGDVVVGWYDKSTGRGHVVDYYLDSKAQCSGIRGTCPDSRIQPDTNNVRLLSATVVNGFTMLTFQRPIKAHDEFDKTIVTNTSQSVIFAVGPINQRQEASYHTARNKDDIFIDFGRIPKWNCPVPDPDFKTTTTTPFPTTFRSTRFPANQSASRVTTVTTLKTTTTTAKPSPSMFKIPPIKCNEPEDRVFYAQIGPTGGTKGYSAITGHVGWGVAIYINGLLVPEIYLVRGRTYTFVVEGGDDPEVPAKYHPFYITDDPEGGYQHKTQDEKKKVKVFAGVEYDNNGGAKPTAAGRLCQWIENSDQPADSFASYGAYQRSLSLQCDEGHPGILHWTPDQNTPDTVYYQCFVHRFLGYKIKVVDDCNENGELERSSSSSEIVAKYVPANPKSEESKLETSEMILTKESASDSMAASTILFSQAQLPDKGSQEAQLFNKKQEPIPSSHLTSAMTHAVPESTITINPTQYSPNNFVQLSLDGQSPLSFSRPMYTQTSQMNAHFPAESQIIRSNVAPPGYTFVDPFGQRIVDIPKLMYDKNRPEFLIGPTRSPLMTQPARYDVLPQIIYASQGSGSQSETQGRPTFIAVQELPVPPQPSPFVRLNTVKARPEQHIMSSEGMKYVNYPTSQTFHDGSGSIRNRPLWLQSRNLPKREGSQEYLLRPHLNIRQESRGIYSSDEGTSEIVKVNETEVENMSFSPLIKEAEETQSVTTEIPLPKPTPAVPVELYVVDELDEIGAENQTDILLTPEKSGEATDSSSGFDHRSVIVESGFRPSSDSRDEDLSEDKLFASDAQEDAVFEVESGPNEARSIKSPSDPINKFKDPQFESFEPVFRPSLPDTGAFNVSKPFEGKGLESTIRTHQYTSNDKSTQHISKVQQYATKKNPQPKHQSQMLPRYLPKKSHYVLPYIPGGRSDQFSHRSQQMYQINERADLQEIVPFTGERASPPIYIASHPRGSSNGGFLSLLNPAPGTVLSYDGRPVYVSDAKGFRFKSHPERKSPSTFNQPKYGSHVGELSYQYHPSKTELFGSAELISNRSSSPNSRLKPVEVNEHEVLSMPPESHVSSRIGIASGIKSRKTNTALLHHPSNMEIIPNHDVTMVYMKGTDEKGLEYELPRILHQLGQEAEEDEREKSKKTQVAVSSGSFELSFKNSESEETLEQLSKNEYKAESTRERTQANNTADLHILTDIWSIINNQDESPKTVSHPTNLKVPHRTKQTFSSRRRQRQGPSTLNNYTGSTKSLRNKREAHHEDGHLLPHDDDDHDHGQHYYENYTTSSATNESVNTSKEHSSPSTRIQYSSSSLFSFASLLLVFSLCN